MARITTISPTRYMRPCIGFSFSAISVRLHNKNTTGRKVPAPPQEIQPAPPHKRRRVRNCSLDCVPKNQPPGSRVLSKGQVAPQSEKGCCDEGARDQCKPGCKRIGGNDAPSGRIAEVNRIRSPALAAQRSRIFTRATSTGPISVWIVRSLYRSNPKSHASHISELVLGDVHLVATQSLGEAATREVDNSPRQFPRSHRSS